MLDVNSTVENYCNNCFYQTMCSLNVQLIEPVGKDKLQPVCFSLGNPPDKNKRDVQ